MKPTLRAALFLTLVLFVPATLLAQPAELAGLDARIEAGMTEWGIPGLAIAVVKDGEVVYARGFGVRELGMEDRVDEHTLFGVASTTKAMTATALAMLVDEGLLDWDDRVIDHMPAFQLSDEWVTRNVTVRDLLTHQVGVGRITGNRVQFMTHEPRSEIIRRMRYHGFEQPFRSSYVYSNVMYSVAGELIPAITGLSWDEFMAQRLFSPLGMTRSNTSIDHIAEAENAAWPHQEINGEVVPIPRRNFDNVGPAASVNASAHDMARWMLFNLGRPGEVDGQRVVSDARMREMRQAQVALPVPDPFAGGLAAYAMGWQLHDYQGYRVVRHGGASDGMNTNLMMIPELDLGVVVLTNTFNNFMTALANEVVDRYIGEERTDWAGRIRASYERTFETATERRARIEALRMEGTSPSLALGEYAGVYADSLYGNVEVRLGVNGLELHFWGDETLVADLEHWHHDTFRAVWRNPAQREKFVWFDLAPDGSADVLNVEFVLRQMLLQVGIYPSDYTRVVRFHRPGRIEGMARRGRN